MNFPENLHQDIPFCVVACENIPQKTYCSDVGISQGTLLVCGSKQSVTERTSTNLLWARSCAGEAGGTMESSFDLTLNQCYCEM